jgi:hypothetical protein
MDNLMRSDGRGFVAGSLVAVIMVVTVLVITTAF